MSATFSKPFANKSKVLNSISMFHLNIEISGTKNHWVWKLKMEFLHTSGSGPGCLTSFWTLPLWSTLTSIRSTIILFNFSWKCILYDIWRLLLLSKIKSFSLRLYQNSEKSWKAAKREVHSRSSRQYICQRYKHYFTMRLSVPIW